MWGRERGVLETEGEREREWRTCEREKIKQRKDDLDFCGCKDFDVAVFGRRETLSLYFEF